jgi:hypothetical protein
MTTGTIDVFVGPSSSPHPSGTIGRCSTCGARIAWFTSAKNRRPIPVDATHESGTFDVASTKVIDGGSVAAIVATSHFATCPNATQHRKVRR